MLIGFSTGADLILCMRNNRTYLSKTDSKNIHCRKCSMYIHSHITVWLLKICLKNIRFSNYRSARISLVFKHFSVFEVYSEYTLTSCGYCSATIIVNSPSLIVIKGSLERLISFSLVRNAIYF